MSGGKDGTLRVFEVDSGQQILHVRARMRIVCRMYKITALFSVLHLD